MILNCDSAEVILDPDDAQVVRQILTEQILVDIASDIVDSQTGLDVGYSIRYFSAEDKGSLVAGMYVPEAEAIKTVRVIDPNVPEILYENISDFSGSGFYTPNHSFPGSWQGGPQTFHAYIKLNSGSLPVFLHSGQLQENVLYEFAAYDEDTTVLVYQDGSTLDIDLCPITSGPFDITLYNQEFSLLRIEETTGSGSQARTRTLEYFSDTTDATADHHISLEDSMGAKTRRYVSTKTAVSGSSYDFKEVIAETDGQDNLIAKTERRYKVFPWNNPASFYKSEQAELLVEIKDPDGVASTTTYTYYDDAEIDSEANYGNLKSAVYPDGQWVAYEYATTGRVAKKYSPYQDSPLAFPLSETNNCVEEFVTSQPGGGIANLYSKIEKVNGSEVARSYTVTFESISDNMQHQALVEALAPGVGWDATPSLRHDKWTYWSGDFGGELAKEKFPDGTMAFYSYSVDPVSGDKTTTVEQGAPNGSETGIQDGVRTITVINSRGGQIGRTVIDVATDIVLSDEASLTFDGLGRPTAVSYMDGSSELFNYQDCCGTLSKTDRTGLVRTATREMDGTVLSVESNGITTSYEEGYDNDASDGVTGFTRTTLVDGRGESDTTATLVETYNPAGELVANIDPRDGINRVSEFNETINAFGQLERTTTLPNAAVQKEIRHADGSFYEVQFDGVTRRRIEYGVVSDTHDGLTFNARTEKEIRLGISGETTEWVKTYRDMAGRIYKVETPDINNTGNSPVALTFYNAEGRQKKVLDADGLKTLYSYNDRGDLEDVALSDNDTIEEGGADRLTRTVRTVLNDPTNGEVIREEVIVWETENDGTPTVVQKTDTATDGLDVWTTRYGQSTHLHRTYGGSGVVTETLTLPDDTVLTTVTTNGFRTGYKVEHPVEGILEEFTYVPDNFDRLQDETNVLLGVTTTREYWDTGLLKQVVTPESDAGAGDSQMITYAYDEMGQLTDTTLPGEKVQSTRYHPDGTVRLVFGQGIYPVEYTYDRQGRIHTMETWKDFDEVSEVGISGSAVTTWRYNDLGLLKQKEDHANKKAVYAYTNAGRLKTREWARLGVDGTNPVKTLYTYGTSGRTKGDLASIDYQNDPASTPSTTYTYDRQGRIKDIFDASGVRELTYENGVLADETYLDDENPETEDPFLGLAIDRSQDSLGRFDQIRLLNAQQSELHKVGYTFDEASRIATVTQELNTATYGYNPVASVRQTLTFNNGTSDIMTVSRAFDDLDRQTSQTSALAGGPTKSYGYLYNDLNQRTRMTFADNAYWQYGYDGLGQVNSAVRKTASGTVIEGYSYGFTFDDIGNRENATLNGRSADYTANLLNQYTERDVPRAIDVRGTANAAATVTVDGQATTRTGNHFYRQLDFSGETSPDEARFVEYMVTGTLLDGGFNNTPRIADAEGKTFLKANPENFVHDDDGNLTSDGRWSYTWDAENRLVAMQTLAGAAAAGVENLCLEFAYDSQGRRFEKKVLSWDGQAYLLQSTTRFLYDGWNLIAELDGQGDLIRSYAWGTDLSGSLQGAGGVGGLLSIKDQASGITCAPFYDGNGNVMGYADMDDGGIVAEFEYGPFGEAIRETGPMAEALVFRFSTKFIDAETGLLYYGYRYYNPETGRWLSRDPLGEEGGVNLYGMVGNAPLNLVDVLGLFSRKGLLKAFCRLKPCEREEFLKKLGKSSIQFFKDDGKNRRLLVYQDSTGSRYTKDNGYFGGTADYRTSTIYMLNSYGNEETLASIFHEADHIDLDDRTPMHNIQDAIDQRANNETRAYSNEANFAYRTGFSSINPQIVGRNGPDATEITNIVNKYYRNVATTVKPRVKTPSTPSDPKPKRDRLVGEDFTYTPDGAPMTAVDFACP